MPRPAVAKHPLSVVALVAVGLATMFSVAGTGTAARCQKGKTCTTTTVAGANWWSASSFLNAKIPTSPAVAPSSSTWVSQLYDAASGINVNAGPWTTTVYHASSSTPKRTIVLNNGWIIDNVPIDPSWVPTPDSDAKLAVIDDTTGCEYEFQGFRPTGITSAEATFKIGTGSGAHVTWGTTGSSISQIAGLIRPEEIAAGVISHALTFAAPTTGPSFVGPATSTDGHTTGGPPEGSLFQLDPTLDVTTLGLNAGQVTIARAMQQYGLYLRDTSSSMALYAQSTADGKTSYGYYLSGIPKSLISHLRVLAPTAQPSLDGWTDTSCAQRHK